ncbi:hypothetical protein M513_02249 [Trichuris suis]|uniref:Domain of unknown function DB domain-containing protein n=1 Tax=Trichuris suis TaxID=68888 RepID=A0A085MIE6_9BILA|nr:hypothetical protein M513_02249 [Trichuris suis]
MEEYKGIQWLRVSKMVAIALTLLCDGVSVSWQRSPQGGTCGSPPDYKPCIPLSKANEIFRECCENLNIGPCIRLCHYDVTLNMARHMFDNGICTVEMIPKYLYCASQGKDNMQCCSKMGVFTAGGDRCRKFCDSAGNKDTITTKDVSCASQLKSVDLLAPTDAELRQSNIYDPGQYSAFQCPFGNQ